MYMWPHFLLTLENIFPMLYQATYLDVICFQTHDTYEHFRNHSWHFFHNSSKLPTSCKQLCFQHANNFQEPLNDSRSLILTRFDIWNLILKIWDSSPQKKTLTWKSWKVFFNFHTCPILCGKVFHPCQLTSCFKLKFNQKFDFPLS